jgi:SAM-dependent methyltransferase
MSGAEWSLFVHHAYDPLDIPSKNVSNFTFLEVGIGVGAWTRILLRDFPNASGVGIDLESNVIELAAQVLEHSNVKLQVLNMINVPYSFENAGFDYIFIPGTLCYADSLGDVYGIIKGLVSHNVLKPGGRMSVTMLASEASETGSCVTRIPKVFWHGLKNYWRVLEIQDMETWKLPHALGRYAVYLERV